MIPLKKNAIDTSDLLLQKSKTSTLMPKNKKPTKVKKLKRVVFIDGRHSVPQLDVQINLFKEERKKDPKLGMLKALKKKWEKEKRIDLD